MDKLSKIILRLRGFYFLSIRKISLLKEDLLGLAYFFRKKNNHIDRFEFNYAVQTNINEENKHFNQFIKVGANWLETPEDLNNPVLKKDIVLCINFNDWKYGFVSRYLKDFRVMFARSSKLNLIPNIIFLRKYISKVYIWSYSENLIFSILFKLLRLKIIRVEDGFLRSFHLGASHSTPQSLVFDSSGLYFNYKTESDLEKIINSDAIDDKEYLKQAENQLEKFLNNKLSKYNHYQSPFFAPNIGAKKIGVIGQVKSDQSIKKGCPKKISIKKLINTAIKENPNKTIYYRPHPDVYNKFQAGKIYFNHPNVILVDPDAHIIDFIDSMDHLYTISSLAGFEAVLRGKKVSVFGLPFYSNWGLTDDRHKLKRRTKIITKTQLFLASYILYPEYLNNIGNANKERGFIFAQDLISSQASKFIAESSIVARQVKTILDSVMNPSSALGLLEYDIHVSKICELDHELLSICILFLLAKTSNQKNQANMLYKFLNGVNSEKASDTFKILSRFLDIYPIIALMKPNNKINIGKLLQKVDSNNEEHRERLLNADTRLVNSSEPILGNILDSTKRNKLLEILSTKALRDFDLNIASLNFHECMNNVLELALYGDERTFSKAWKLFYENFDYKNEEAASAISSLFSPKHQSFLPWRGFMPKDKVNKSLVLNAKLTSMPGLLLWCQVNYPDLLESFKIEIRSLLNVNDGFDTNIHTLLIDLGLKDELNDLFLSKLGSDLNYEDHCNYVEYLLLIDENQKALKNIKYLHEKYNTSRTFKLYLKILIIKGDFLQANSIFSKKPILGGPMYERKIAFGIGDIEAGMSSYSDNAYIKSLKIYYKEKYYDPSISKIEPKSLFLLTMWGPGDEIRFSSIYNKIEKFHSNQILTLACSPKLEKLFNASFKNINFLGIDRTRGINIIDKENYKNSLGRTMSALVNDIAIDSIQRHEALGSITDYLPFFLKNYESFDSDPFLEPLAEDVLRASEKYNFKTKKIKVGISWRSSLNNAARNEHYLNIDQLLPLFEEDMFQFYNLQYDECDAEIAEINDRNPNKIINFENLDQADDLYSVACVMKNLDIIISPATTVVELAGALGIKTLLFTNSHELQWRKINDQNQDVFYSNTEIIDASGSRDKKILVQNILTRLKELA